MIVDGYNLIFAWDELKALAAARLDLAREKLCDLLSGYAGFTGKDVVLVFDGFRTAGNPGSKSEVHNIRVAYTAARPATPISSGWSTRSERTRRCAS